MKSLQGIVIKTSLPNTCESRDDLKIVFEAFDTFECAKRRLSELLKELAFQENAMFDGNGYLKQFSNYINEMENALKDDDWFKECEPDGIACSDGISLFSLKELHEALHRIFCSTSAKLPFGEQEYEDLYLQVYVSDGCVHLEGYFEGPCNGIDPYIKTNMFDMSEEKDYMLYINDRFCNQEYSSKLYIDMQKIMLREQQQAGQELYI